MRCWTLLVVVLPAVGQWLNYPTAGIPRLPDGRPDLAAPAPRLADGHPDFSGLWDPAMEGATPAGTLGGALLAPAFENVGIGMKDGLPFRPWARAQWQARQDNNQKDSPAGRCLPTSPLLVHTHPLPRKMVHVPGFLAILHEQNINFRQIFTDGRPLPVDPQPSWNGYSSATWDGDTLVIQTIGFRDDLWVDSSGTAISDQARMTERIRRINFGTLVIEATIDDPKTYTAPWSLTINQRIKLDTDLLEYVCLENEKDLPHIVGR
jgi:hypothetical protein